MIEPIGDLQRGIPRLARRAAQVVTDRGECAIHRVWLQDPAQRRAWRLHHGTARDRHITAGCVNVAPAVYQALAGYAVVRIER